MLKVLLTHKWGSRSESQHHYWDIQGLLNSKWLEFWLWANLRTLSAAWLSPSCHIAQNNNRGWQGRKPISPWGNRKKHENDQCSWGAILENRRKMQHIVKFLQQGHWAESCKQIGMISSHWTHSGFFLGAISPNFNLENMISTYMKDILWKKWPKYARFQRKKIPNHQIFMISSSRQPKI